MITGKYPSLRLRRNRKFDWTRRLIRENDLSANDLILPIFLTEGKNKHVKIPSMPGIFRYSIDNLPKIIDKALSITFGIISTEYLNTPGIFEILLFLFLPSDKNIGKIKSFGDKSFSLINLLDQLNFLFLLSLNDGYLPVIISILYIYLCDKSYIYYINF